MNTKIKYANSVEILSISLIIFIIVSLSGYWVFTTLIHPISSFYKDYEAEILYFMNSLAIFKGESYFYLDHPETPVEILGSIILGFFYSFSGRNAETFIQSQILNPEPFFIVAHILLTVASILCALLLYRIAFLISPQKQSDLVLAAALVQQLD